MKHFGFICARISDPSHQLLYYECKGFQLLLLYSTWWHPITRQGGRKQGDKWFHLELFQRLSGRLRKRNQLYSIYTGKGQYGKALYKDSPKKQHPLNLCRIYSIHQKSSFKVRKEIDYHDVA